MKDTEFTCN